MRARQPTLSPASRATFWRSLQTLGVTRIVIALVLLLYLIFGGGGGAAARGTALHLGYGEICTLYLLLALGFAGAAVYWRHRFLSQLLAQLALDFGVISLLYLDGGGVRSGLAILYLLPLAGAAILAPLLLALFGAALVTLFMLGESAYQTLMFEGDKMVAQSGLYGMAFFSVVLLVSRLAARLIGQEELAAQRGNALAIQQAINRLVIADMGDGIVVLGRDGRVATANPAAQRMLGLARVEADCALGRWPALQPLDAAWRDWLADPARGAAFVTIKPYHDPADPDAAAGRRTAARLRLRFASVDTAGLADERCVIFLQDVGEIENQAQQLKLASMGRLTASIAHEVRNPLSAIGHATALLAEDLDGPVQRRLLRIVGDNVSRVDRMVEDILRLSRKAQTPDAGLVLAPFLTELVDEFGRTQSVAAGVVRLDDAGAATVRFDPLHLREIVLNLLGNALRYASGTAGSLHLFVASASGRTELHVRDDGPAISPEVRAHLFEPFYTTSSKGTGLGLYLARELCLNNGALLDYEYRHDCGAQAEAAVDAGGRFVITFAP